MMLVHTRKEVLGLVYVFEDLEVQDCAVFVPDNDVKSGLFLSSEHIFLFNHEHKLHKSITTTIRFCLQERQTNRQKKLESNQAQNGRILFNQSTDRRTVHPYSSTYCCSSQSPNKRQEQNHQLPRTVMFQKSTVIVRKRRQTLAKHKSIHQTNDLN